MSEFRSTLRLLWLFVRLNWEANRANPANLTLAAVGMVANNLLFLGGMWVMLFSGKQDNSQQAPYFFVLSAVVPIAWGLIQFFWGGLYVLPHLIEEGDLDPWLATPRSPLLLSAVSRSSPAAAGDVIQGFLVLIGLPWIVPQVAWDFHLRAWLSLIPCTLGFGGLMVLCAAFPFYLSRGSTLSYFFLETQIAFSSYPTGKLFQDKTRLLIALLPAGATAVLPMDWVESGSAHHLALALGALIALWVFAISLFRMGLRRYRSGNRIALKGS